MFNDELNLQLFQSKETHTYNTIVNEYLDFTEIVCYKEPLRVSKGTDIFVETNTGELLVKNIDRSRKFKQVDGVLVPTTSSATIEKLSNTIKQSRKRSLDNLYGYCLSNKWKYFITLTFAPDKVNRDDEEEIKYCWQKFKQALQYYNKFVKIFAIPERHPTSKKLHFHCLVGNINLKPFITRAINPHTNKPIFSNGRAVYNLNLFKFGFSTLVNIDDNQLIVVNYLTKYIVKDFGNIGFNKKTYYHTRNLNYKSKKFYYLKGNEFDFNLIEDCKYKDNDKMTIYRLPVFKQIG